MRAVSGSISICLVADLRRLCIWHQFETLGALLPLKSLPLSPGQVTAFAVVEYDPDGMDEAGDSTDVTATVRSDLESYADSVVCNSQGQELEDEVEPELCIAASDAEHGCRGDCGPIDQRVKHITQRKSGRLRHSRVERGRQSIRTH